MHLKTSAGFSINQHSPMNCQFGAMKVEYPPNRELCTGYIAGQTAGASPTARRSLRQRESGPAPASGNSFRQLDAVFGDTHLDEIARQDAMQFRIKGVRSSIDWAFARPVGAHHKTGAGPGVVI